MLILQWIFGVDRERKCSRAILRLAQQFPGDPGAMSPLFLNYLLIAPGESFFMAANEPHAYVAGEIIECMACSDNVVSLYRQKLKAEFCNLAQNCWHELIFSKFSFLILRFELG